MRECKNDRMRKYIFMVVCLLMMAGVSTVEARKQKVAKVYIFGMAAAFTDTIVHFTNIQALDSVWIDSKNKFLQEREAYSYQLREYLKQQQAPNRTCIVFYSPKREKLEKKYQKMLRLYGKAKDGAQHFDVRFVTDDDFKFKRVITGEESNE